MDTILDKKGSDILLLDLRDEAIFTDYFLICSGDSKRQLKSLADSISQEAKNKGDVKPWGQEGEPEDGWVLIDYGDLVVHLFNPDTRNYYDLEDLWQNAHIVLRMQ
ncbi:MAG: ribosome silencing factor [Candidatus Promineifilaceae bacterium]